MSRSAKKGPYVNPKILKKSQDSNLGTQNTPLKVYDRACQVHPKFVGKWYEVYQGKNWIKLFVREDMVGHRFGEFAPTRTFKGHGQIVKRTMTKT